MSCFSFQMLLFFPYSELKKGTFLVASPDIEGGIFYRSVVLLCDHSPVGSFGLIVNKPLHIQLEEDFFGLEGSNAQIDMRAGETDKCEIIDSENLTSLAISISESLKHIGNLDVDVMEDKNGNLFCLDFNPRFGGGYPASHLAGMNFLEAIIDMKNNSPVNLPKKPSLITLMKGISLYSMEK